MNNLFTWAKKWGIPEEAAIDLRDQMGVGLLPLNSDSTATTEEGVSKRVRLTEAAKGNLLWRNNVGAMQDDRGRVIRYGLANDSKAMNQRIKSSDLIGITPVTVTDDMVGNTVGVFTAIEVKKPGWVYVGSDREIAQRRFIELVMSRGGIAHFTNGVDDVVTKR